MLRKTILIIIVAAMFIFCGYALNRRAAKSELAADDNLRIVSLAPSITDSLFTLGLGDNVVGVTEYCIYPPEAQTRTIVGSLYDHNYELIARLTSHVVFLNKDQEKALDQFRALGIEAVVFNNSDIESILETFRAIGRYCNKEPEAEAVVNDMTEKLEMYRAIAANLPPVRAMVCVGRGMGGMSVTEVYAAGPQTYVGSLLEIAGGENIYQGGIAYPVLSSEAVLRLNPDVIIELVPEVQRGKTTVEEIIAQWSPLTDINAVKNNRIYVLTEGYTVLPGPQLIFLLEDIMRVLYPAAGLPS